MTLTELLSRLDNVVPSGDQWLATCPAHADDRASLSIGVGSGGRALLHCFAGCSIDDILAALHLGHEALRLTGDLAPAVPRHRAQESVPAEELAALQADIDRWAADLLQDTDEAAAVREYAQDRWGLTREDLIWHGLGLRTSGSGARLVVPMVGPDGERRGWQARAVTGTPEPRWLGPRAPSTGAWSAVGVLRGRTGWPEILVTEGPGDALTAAQAGYTAVAILGAGRVTDPAVAAAVAAHVGQAPAVLAGDDDAAGRAFDATLASALAANGTTVRVLPIPTGGDLTGWRAASHDWPADLCRAVAAAGTVTPTQATLATRDLASYPLSDTGNALYLRDVLAAQGAPVRFAPGIGWLRWDGGVWRPIDEELTRQAAQETMLATHRDLLARAGEHKRVPPDLKDALEWARASQSMMRIDAMIKALKATDNVYTSDSLLDTHKDLLTVSNGVVDLRTGELTEHNPELLLTKSVRVAYRPDAPAPRWTTFLAEVTDGHPELEHYLQTLIGYGITGNTVEQCLAIFYGRGANGKSVFTSVIGSVFADYTRYPAVSTFAPGRGAGQASDDLAALKGVRLALTNESDSGQELSEALVKEITGGTRITARRLYRSQFEFDPEVLVIMATNSKPALRGVDEALWRRIKLVPWTRYLAPEERDPYLAEHLLATESEGILAWAVQGAKTWYADRLIDPPIVRRATADYRTDADPLDGFLGEVYLVDHDSTGRIPAKEVWQDYQLWVMTEHVSVRRQFTRGELLANLEAHGTTRTRASHVDFIHGLTKVSGL